MSLQLEILVSGVPLDLFEGEAERFYITKQIDDVIKGLSTREGDFTRNITVPRTTKNIELLTINRFQAITANRVDFVSCKVYFKGILVINDGQLIANQNTKRSISLSIFGGNASFFRQLSDDTLQALDLTEYDFEWNLATVRDRRNNDAGLVTPVSIFTDNNSFLVATNNDAVTQDLNLDVLNLQWGGFWFYFKTMLEEIFKNLQGLTVDFSGLDEDFDKLIFAVPIPGFIRSLGLAESYNSSGMDPDPVEIGPNTFVWVIPTVFNDPLGVWDPTGNNNAGAWVIPEAGLCLVRVSLDGAIHPRVSGSNRDTVIEILADGLLIDSRVIVDQLGGSLLFDETLLISFDANIGSEVTLKLTTGDLFGAGPKVVLGNLLFQVQKANEEQDRNLTISNLMPEISQKQFVLNVLNWFHIVANERNRVVVLSYWEEIPGKAAKISKSAANEQTVFRTLLSNYGQSNIIKYADNDLVQRLDLTTQFPVASNVLDPLVVKINLIFSGTDVFEGPTLNVLTPPFFDYVFEKINNNKLNIDNAGLYSTPDANDLALGDVIRVSGSNRQVTNVLNNREGTVTPILAVVNAQDWDFLHYNNIANDGVHIGYALQAQAAYKLADGVETSEVFTDHKQAVWRRFLSMTGIINNYFSKFVRIVERPAIIEIWIDLNVLEFVSLDSTDIIYIEDLGANFYINKIEQFKVIGLVRMELLKV